MWCLVRGVWCAVHPSEATCNQSSREGGRSAVTHRGLAARWIRCMSKYWAVFSSLGVCGWVLGVLGGVSQSQLPCGPWGLDRRGDRRAGAVAGLFRLVTEREGPRGLMGLAESGGARGVVRGGSGGRLAGRRLSEARLALSSHQKESLPILPKGMARFRIVQ